MHAGINNNIETVHFLYRLICFRCPLPVLSEKIHFERRSSSHMDIGIVYPHPPLSSLDFVIDYFTSHMLRKATSSHNTQEEERGRGKELLPTGRSYQHQERIYTLLLRPCSRKIRPSNFSFLNSILSCVQTRSKL